MVRGILAKEPHNNNFITEYHACLSMACSEHAVIRLFCDLLTRNSFVFTRLL